MKDKKLRYSIVVPCYNEAQFLPRTLGALKNQTYSGNYEIIVVDNNCTDETAAVAKSFGVRIIHESTPGVCSARQAGTEAARGEIVISTDADTLQPENWLQNIDDVFKSCDKYVAVAGPCAYVDGPWWGMQYPKILFGTVSALSKVIGRPFYITATNTAFKKSAWTGYNTSLTQGGDELELLHDLKKQGKVAFNNNNPVHTSARRLNRGLVYNLFMTFLTYYMLGYYLNRLTGKTVIGMAPAYRTVKPSGNKLAQYYKLAFGLFLITVVHLPGHETILQDSYEAFVRVSALIINTL